MKRMISGLVLFTMLLSLMPFALAEDGEQAQKETEEVLTESAVSVQYLPKNAANKETSVEFDNLRKTLSRYNYSVRALDAALDSLDGSTDALDDAVSMMKNLLKTYSDNAAEAGMMAAKIKTKEISPESAAIYAELCKSWQADATLLSMQIQSMEAQIDSAETSIEKTENTLRNSINQIVKGAESLYIGILTMENAIGDAQRGIDTLERVVKITEKQKELGMASDYDVETMKYNFKTAKSQLESLKYQIRTSKITLEGMLGMELNGTVTLGALKMPTEEELSAVDYAENLSKSTDRNVDVMNAEEDEDTGSGSEESVKAARDSFAYQFKIICLAVPEQQRLLKAAGDTVTYQKRTVEIAAKKYELGMLSHEEYLAAEGELKSAQSAYHTAELNLFTAYNAYQWATQYGIV